MSNFDWGILEACSLPTDIKKNDYSSYGFPSIRFLEKGDNVKLISNYKDHPEYIKLSSSNKEKLENVKQLIDWFGYISYICNLNE